MRMSHRRSLQIAFIGLFGLGLMSAPGRALGQLFKAEQTCVNALNTGLAKVSEAQGRVNSQCVKDGRREKTSKLGPSETIEGCLTADVRQRVSRRQQTNFEKEARRCQGPFPSFGATDAETVNAAAADQELALIHDVFNLDLDAVIVPLDVASGEAPDSVISRCQEKIATQTQKCMDIRFREYNKCGKKGLQGGRNEILYPGAVSPFDDALDLEQCMGWDRKSKIAACEQRLLEKIDGSCECVALGAAIPGACFDAAEPAACLNRLTACRSCLALNAADDLNQDCDLFDDDAANGTCPPTLPACGDGILQAEAGEECDDNSSADGDGCSSVCLEEAGSVCQGEPSSCVPSCGNGTTDSGEECDDGNSTDEDGCSDNCGIEDGFSCTGTPSTCETICGNGLVHGAEDCDDANTADGDGCSGGCETESGYACVTEPPFLECPPDPSSCVLTCGNAVINQGESCDDANTGDGDGCASDCEIEPGFECAGQPSVCTIVVPCGNGVLDPNTEACDDGNQEDGDCCSSACQIEPASTVCRADAGTCDMAENCTGLDPNCPADVVEGAGLECRASVDVCDVAEQCDGLSGVCPGNVVESNDTECRPSTGPCDPAEKCLGISSFCPPDILLTTECRASTAPCDAAEVCDGVSGDCPIDVLASAGAECRASTAPCDAAEVCNGVSSTCPVDVLASVGTECRAATGGCDVVENCTGTDPSCPADVLEPDGTGCNDSDACTSPDQCLSGICAGTSLCGNGVTDGACGEVCDDGNTSNFDGCSDLCLTELGSHKCVLDDPNATGAFCAGGVNDGLPCTVGPECPDGLCQPVSGFLIHTALFPITVVGVGSVDIHCSAIDPSSGKAACQCAIQNFDPVNLVGIGFICIGASDPNDPCPLGEIDCDGGNAFDIDMISDHNIGSCTSNPGCETQCGTYCAGLSKSVFDSGCEGFCEGGASNGSVCTADAGCPGGACNGKDGVPHGNICGCSCLDIGGGASVAGGLQCNLGASIVVETAAPCGDGDPLIVVGTTCIPFTTEMVSALITNGNDVAGSSVPPGGVSTSGTAALCNDLAVSTATGTVLVGAVNFFDSTIGDLAVDLVFTCR